MSKSDMMKEAVTVVAAFHLPKTVSYVNSIFFIKIISGHIEVILRFYNFLMIKIIIEKEISYEH